MDLTEPAIQALLKRGAMDLSTVPTADGGHAVLVPQGYELEVIPPLEPPLTHIKQHVTFYDVPSFNQYVKQFQNNATTIYAQTARQSSGDTAITAVFDSHTADQAGRCAHTAKFAPAYSEQWMRWTRAKTMLQVEFAEFIEENRKDITEPNAAMLLDLVSKFKATKKVEYNSLVYQPNGDVIMGWDERTEGANGQPLNMPTALKLGIPVFFKGPRYEVPVFLRYNIKDGKMYFTLKVDRGDYIEQDAFDAIAFEVAEASGLPVLNGKPTK